jgi:hypothetical protein
MVHVLVVFTIEYVTLAETVRAPANSSSAVGAWYNNVVPLN